jgi:hypothetical protein
VALRLGRYRQEISDYLRRERVPGRPLRALLIFAALYHDTGKPDTRQRNESGDWSFSGRVARSAELVAVRAEALHFSRAEIEFLRTVVAQHWRPTELARAGGLPDRRGIYLFFQTTGEHGIAICLHSVADLMGKYGPELPRDELEARLDVLRALMEAYYEHHEEIVAPIPLLDGSELMEALQLAPGTKVGQILAALREAQAAGEVNTREGALKLARKLNT